MLTTLSDSLESGTMYRRYTTDMLVSRLREGRGSMQIVLGPRQSGKTTSVRQAVDELGLPFVYAARTRTADRARRRLDARWSSSRSAGGRGRSAWTRAPREGARRACRWCSADTSSHSPENLSLIHISEP